VGYVYEWRFYHTEKVPGAIEVVELIESLIEGGARVIRYQDLVTRSSVVPRVPIAASQLVTADGHVAVRLSFPLDGGRIQLFLQVFAPEGSAAFASLSLDEDILKAHDEPASSLLVELGLRVAAHLPVHFAWADHDLSLQRLEPVLDLTQVKALAWANLFSRSLADRISLEPLRGAPGYQVRELPQGLLYLLAPTPLEPPMPAALAYLQNTLPGALLSQW